MSKYIADLTKFSPQSKLEVLTKILTKYEKIGDHMLRCSLKEEICEICPKIITIVAIILEIEKKENRKIENVEEILNKFDVEELILKDNDMFKILGFFLDK